MRERISRYPQLQHQNATGDALYGNMVSFRAPESAFARILTECKARNVRVTPSERDFRIRVSAHIFTLPTDLNLFFDALDAALRT